MPTPDWYRDDGSQKGSGFLGVMKRPDGGVMSELSVGAKKLPTGAIVPEDNQYVGKYIDVPSMVPTLNPVEIHKLLLWREGQQIDPNVLQKAADFASKRSLAGQSVFAKPGEQNYAASPDIPRAAAPTDVPLATSQQSVNPQALVNLLVQRQLGK